mmetsp:Transcript_7946/g.17231  ORF Transcript_7946/g.17231 Transcript_7946/m.17231 type:complete len:279 (+) Transcript_7946:342-1178(+)
MWARPTKRNTLAELDTTISAAALLPRIPEGEAGYDAQLAHEETAAAYENDRTFGQNKKDTTKAPVKLQFRDRRIRTPSTLVAVCGALVGIGTLFSESGRAAFLPTSQQPSSAGPELCRYCLDIGKLLSTSGFRRWYLTIRPNHPHILTSLFVEILNMIGAAVEFAWDPVIRTLVEKGEPVPAQSFTPVWEQYNKLRGMLNSMMSTGTVDTRLRDLAPMWQFLTPSAPSSSPAPTTYGSPSAYNGTSDPPTVPLAGATPKKPNTSPCIDIGTSFRLKSF